MKNLIIIGVGGFARELYWNCQNSLGYGTEWQLKGFLDGDVKLPQEEYKKLLLPVLGDINSYKIEEDDVFTIAIADGNAKERLSSLLESKGAEFINIIHKTAYISGNVKIGRGCVFGPNTGIGDSATIGNFVLLNNHTGVGHDAVIGDYTSAMSYVDITGYCTIGKKVFLASKVSFVPHAKAEDCSYVGIGSVVFKRVKAGKKVFGNPAREVEI